MFYDNDLDGFLNTNEFAKPVTYIPVTLGTGGEKVINGIFDGIGADVKRGDTLIEVTEPQIICKESDIPDPFPGDKFIIDGIAYVFSDHKPTGTGMQTIKLRRDE
jgi:hypothetical protein